MYIISLPPTFAGLVLCLFFNVIAVTVCWIRGGGKCFIVYMYKPLRLLNILYGFLFKNF